MVQLKNELKRGCTFDRWMKGVLNFPSTYKYESDEVIRRMREQHRLGVIRFRDIKLLKYRRSELNLSDYRQVTD
ncbi:hypothetical protein ZOSMA_173G00230 [Zostera marina]|uniref:Uncharacterized protein n=1 Tax=Zostera marina TaxID=29655 RepID=A0A0K9PSA5_ZOSMR|nr:hypothetical protein ZOSMA_173G00230 [Zostera marina]